LYRAQDGFERAVRRWDDATKPPPAHIQRVRGATPPPPHRGRHLIRIGKQTQIPRSGSGLNRRDQPRARHYAVGYGSRARGDHLNRDTSCASLLRNLFSGLPPKAALAAAGTARYGFWGFGKERRGRVILAPLEPRQNGRTPPARAMGSTPPPILARRRRQPPSLGVLSNRPGHPESVEQVTLLGRRFARTAARPDTGPAHPASINSFGQPLQLIRVPRVRLGNAATPFGKCAHPLLFLSCANKRDPRSRRAREAAG